MNKLRFPQIMLYMMLLSMGKSTWVDPKCQIYKVKSGDYSYKIINDVCGVSTGCSNNGATLRNREGKHCPSSILVDEDVEVCCTRKPEPCTTHTVKLGDNSWKVVHDKCKYSSGCTTNSTQVPTIVDTKRKIHCPRWIYTGEKLTVCCDSTFLLPGELNPTPDPTPAPTPSTSTKPTPPKGKCKSSRTVKPGDKVFITIDDGPSSSSREHLLRMLRSINAKVTFYESGYNVCNDKSTPTCHHWAYAKNIKNLADTVKDGHMLACHSDNHYYDANQGICSYSTVKPTPRTPNSEAKCGTEPVQNMVEGSRLLEAALRHDFAAFKTDAEKKLRDQAIKDVWTVARLPCSDIWRTKNIKEDNIGWLKPEEKAIRKKVADTMYSGNVKCRPSVYSGIPWELHGFDPMVDWKKDQIVRPNEVCTLVELIEREMENEANEFKKGQMVLLTHDFYFDTAARAKVLGEVMVELRAKGYQLPTMREFKG